MKTQSKILLLILLYLSSGIYGQLQIDAGKDTSFCYNENQDSVEIGGNPTAIGGVGSYTYTWSANYPNYASYLLSDTTSSNPIIINSTEDYVIIKLTVVDSLGNTKEDSVIIRAVEVLQTLIGFSPVINRGDTLTLNHNYYYYAVEPLHYNWTPDYNISNLFISNPKVWPDTSVQYRLDVVDSLGCIAGLDFVYVTVNPTEIFLNSMNMEESIVIPNPITSNSIISFISSSQDRLILKIYIEVSR